MLYLFSLYVFMCMESLWHLLLGDGENPDIEQYICFTGVQLSFIVADFIVNYFFFAL